MVSKNVISHRKEIQTKQRHNNLERVGTSSCHYIKRTNADYRNSKIKYFKSYQQKLYFIIEIATIKQQKRFFHEKAMRKNILKL